MAVISTKVTDCEWCGWRLCVCFGICESILIKLIIIIYRMSDAIGVAAKLRRSRKALDHLPSAAALQAIASLGLIMERCFAVTKNSLANALHILMVIEAC